MKRFIRRLICRWCNRKMECLTSPKCLIDKRLWRMTYVSILMIASLVMNVLIWRQYVKLSIASLVLILLYAYHVARIWTSKD